MTYLMEFMSNAKFSKKKKYHVYQVKDDQTILNSVLELPQL